MLRQHQRQRCLQRGFQRGVTLIELVIGMLVLGIAIVLITSSLLPLGQRSVDPWHQVRAAELGQSLMNEILGKRFDENSPLGGQKRCDESGAPACTDVAALGPDGGEGRSDYDDVDDYNGLDLTGDAITNILDQQLLSQYRQYRIQVAVGYDGNHNGVLNEAGAEERLAKRITVTVTTPGGQAIVFSAYRGNW
ncbi:prepilin-type N-terminal cleavage/methylation domain-containing protein [Gallaecimonas kandeliae]|uniref:type IV pilus modification PilV family protein n=1 Tax=Gallaecimonas kandeliae TaxID=3029055 RepID=UPI0026478368|nr:prepilin-type N-terminal cleavage/methylation domain-containing protein [Gallaecimonas kandeliae]WKE66024.1 prepilin-type N-terminal cleavage/methylation domain-containing protein [Gallaecimonas kandeliae]